MVNLGCKLNQFEGEVIARELVKEGFEVVEDGTAEVCIINTCTVTNVADKKSIKAIKKSVKENASSKIIITGCLATTDAEVLKKLFPNAIIVKNPHKYLIPELLKNSREKLEGDHRLDYAFLDPTPLNRTRAFLKIQDGCTERCSYCKIPFARGKSVSLPIHKTLELLERLLDQGYKEIVLTGVNIGEYESEGNKLADLLEKIFSLEKKYPHRWRIRLTSLLPNLIPHKLIDLLDNERLCPHIHLSVQSGSNKILKLMNRRYTREDVLSIVERAYKKNKNLTFTGDIIVGFPGETEEDYKDTKELIKEVGFIKVHIFPFSVRRGTIAEKLEKEMGVPEKEKKERAEDLRNFSNQVAKEEIRRRFIYTVVESLMESQEEGTSENYLKITLRGYKILKNEFVNVRVIDVGDKDSNHVIGEAIQV